VALAARQVACICQHSTTVQALNSAGTKQCSKQQSHVTRKQAISHGRITMSCEQERRRSLHISATMDDQCLSVS
jgi:hypothetical protein